MIESRLKDSALESVGYVGDTVRGRLRHFGAESVGYMGDTTGGRLGTRTEGDSGTWGWNFRVYGGHNWMGDWGHDWRETQGLWG